MEASDLKRELAKARSAKRGKYPSALREAVVEYAAREKKRGKSQGSVASELGMSTQTLCYWRALARHRGGLSPVTIIAKPEPKQDVVVECGPLRVRGLDVAGVADLLRRLG
jgi:transposase-like protein